MLIWDVRVEMFCDWRYTGVIESLSTTVRHVALKSPQEIKDSLVLSQ